MNFRRKSVFAYLLILIFMFNGNITKARNFLNPPDDKYLAFAEVMPAPIGGIGAITKTIKYPTIAKQSGIEGKVYVLAHINENGVAEEVKVVRGIGGGCDDAAVEAVKKAKYTPGKNKGKAVKVKLTMAITFKLS